MKNNILVIGGTGKTGRKVAERLTAKGMSVRIGSRSADPAFDWQNSSTWQSALEGMDKVYITFQPDLAVPGAADAIRGLVAEAENQGVQKLVLLSGMGEKEAERCEQIVIESGIDHTIVRATWFNQNFSESFFLEPLLAGHVALPRPEAKVPYIDTDDIADVAVAALLDDQHNGQIYELTGPRTLTFEQIIDEISVATDRAIEYSPISLDAYIDMLKAHQLPSEEIWLIKYLFSEVLGVGKNAIVSHDVEKVLGRKAKDFLDYVKETAASGIWNPMESEAIVN